MIASLYQSGSLALMGRVDRSGIGVVRGIEESALQPEDVARLKIGVESYVVARATPAVARTGEQILHDVRRIGIEPELRARDVDDGLLRARRIEIHDDEHIVAPPRRRFREEEDLRILRDTKGEIV